MSRSVSAAQLALARAHPAMIESHDLECRGKGGDLCHPIGAMFAKARHEHDGWTCAGNVIGQRSAIDRDHQRVMLPEARRGGGRILPRRQGKRRPPWSKSRPPGHPAFMFILAQRSCSAAMLGRVLINRGALMSAMPLIAARKRTSPEVRVVPEAALS